MFAARRANICMLRRSARRRRRRTNAAVLVRLTKVPFDRVRQAIDFGHRAGAAREPASAAEAEAGAGTNGSGAGQTRRAEAAPDLNWTSGCAAIGNMLGMGRLVLLTLAVDGNMCTANQNTTVGNGLEIFCQPGFTFPCYCC